MNKKELIKELNDKGCEFSKIRFYSKSPYQKNRFKPEFVGWEAWVYTKANSHFGALITQESWEHDKELEISSLH